MKYIYMVISLFLLLGCTPTTPKATEYRLNLKMQTEPLSEQKCKKDSLKVGQSFSANALKSLDMHYGLGEYKRLVFSQALWAESPNKAITMAITKYIREIKLFKNVQISKSRSRNGLLLETDIEDFMQYFSEDEKSSYANVRISFTLIDSKNSQVISTKTFSQKERVMSNNANGGVIALNKAVEKLLQESGKWLSGVCR